MSRVSTARRGFTLIEVMIAVAIIGILASTAVSMFQLQTQRTKRTEAMTNLEAMAKMQRAYFGENGSHPSVFPVPLGPPGEKQNWDPASSAAFGTLGFNIEGSVYYVYDVNSSTGICACPSNGCFTGAAYGDSDRDTGVAVVGYFHPDATGASCPVLMMPAVTAPIDPIDGLPIYDQPVDIFTFSGPIVDDY